MCDRITERYGPARRFERHRYLGNLAHLFGHLIEQGAELGRSGPLFAEIPNCLSCLFNGCAVLVPSRVEQSATWSGLVQIERNDRLEKSRSADAALDDGVVHLSRNAVSFLEDGFKSHCARDA